MMADTVASVPRAAIERTIGRCDADEVRSVEDGLRLWLGLG